MLVLFVKKFYTFSVIARGVSPARPAVSHRRALGTNGGDPGQESNLLFAEKYLLNRRLLRKERSQWHRSNQELRFPLEHLKLTILTR
jgi:hypothetical protein